MFSFRQRDCGRSGGEIVEPGAVDAKDGYGVMDSWTGTWRLVAVMGAVAISYLVGRWVAEMVQRL